MSVAAVEIVTAYVPFPDKGETGVIMTSSPAVFELTVKATAVFVEAPRRSLTWVQATADVKELMSIALVKLATATAVHGAPRARGLMEKETIEGGVRTRTQVVVAAGRLAFPSSSTAHRR